MASNNINEQPDNLREVEFTIRELTVFRDGSTHRGPMSTPLVPACPSPPFPHHQVASKDLPLHVPAHGSSAPSLRLFLPPSSTPTTNKKLPILLYFHGGAFVLGSTAEHMTHNYLCKLALSAQVLIVSVEYRLAPENPHPAVYDDCFGGLLWLFQQHAATTGGSSSPGEPWLVNHGDFSKVFLGGDSAGGNIVHNVAMQAAGHGTWKSHRKALSHLHVEATCQLRRQYLRGMMLFDPFFTCGHDKAVALHLIESQVLNACRVSADHPSVDPFSSIAAAPSVAAASLPPALVLVAELDYLRERGVAYYQGLLDAGKDARLFVTPNEDHVFHILNPTSPNIGPLLDAVSSFINQCAP